MYIYIYIYYNYIYIYIYARNEQQCNRVIEHGRSLKPIFLKQLGTLTDSKTRKIEAEPWNRKVLRPELEFKSFLLLGL